eukprot:Sspe_Gene.104634::Locus_81319_Transcript_1_1_Confidence_1.000_Length_722::g.104634::m.104634
MGAPVPPILPQLRTPPTPYDERCPTCGSVRGEAVPSLAEYRAVCAELVRIQAAYDRLVAAVDRKNTVLPPPVTPSAALLSPILAASPEACLSSVPPPRATLCTVMVKMGSGPPTGVRRRLSVTPGGITLTALDGAVSDVIPLCSVAGVRSTPSGEIALTTHTSLYTLHLEPWEAVKWGAWLKGSSLCTASPLPPSNSD